MQTHQFNVQGMTCGGCMSSVQRALSNLDGVGRVDVTLQPGAAIIHADPAKVTAAQIQSMLLKLGYAAQLAQTVV